MITHKKIHSMVMAMAAKTTNSEQELLNLFLRYLRTPADALTEYDRMDRDHITKKLRMIADNLRREPEASPEK